MAKLTAPAISRWAKKKVIETLQKSQSLFPWTDFLDRNSPL
jgi:hypothetical protein